MNPRVVDPPKVTYQPDPEYTESARHKRVEGTTIILVVVNEKGFPEILEITKGFDEGLDPRTDSRCWLDLQARNKERRTCSGAD